MNKLSTKTLMIAAVLLLLESVFVGSYLFLLIKAEEESTKQKRAKEVISTTNDLMNSLFIAGDNVSKSIFHPGEESSVQYTAACKDVSAKLAWLHAYGGGDLPQQKLLGAIDAKTRVALKMLSDTKRIAESQEPAVAIQYGLRVRLKFQKHLEGLVQDLIRFLNTEKQIEKSSPKAMKTHRDYQRWLLIIAFASNCIAALSVAMLFIRGITARLSIVVENSERLLRRENLHAPLQGDDELAQLDRSFHSMSASLKGEEELIKANENQIRAMIDQMPLGLAILDSKNEIEYANPALAKMLAVEDHALTGKSFSEYFGVAKSALDKNGEVVEATAMTCAGEELRVDLSFVDDTFARRSSKIAVVVDVTDRHAVEKMKQAFVAMVSHELRTPLTSVAGFLQLLPLGVYGEIKPEAAVQSNQTAIQVDQLIVLINDLLDLEKLEAGKMQLSKARVSLDDIIEGALDAVHQQAEIAAAELLFDGCEDYLACDSDRLRQALTKMLSSFLRLCGHNPRIRVAVNSSAAESITISLTCSRLELDANRLASLFEPFQMALDGAGSLGLGFTLARAIAVNHGGTCGAGAANGSGTRVWLRVPTGMSLVG